MDKGKKTKGKKNTDLTSNSKADKISLVNHTDQTKKHEKSKTEEKPTSN